LALGTKFEPFLRGSYELATKIVNKFFELDKQNAQAAKIAEAQVKAQKDSEKATTEAIKISITNINAKIRAEKELETLYKDTFSTTDKANKTEFELAKRTLERKQNEIKVLRVYRDTLADIVKHREKEPPIIQKTQEELKKEYAQRLSILELERKSRELRAIQNQDQAGALQAQKLFLDEKLKLDESYFGQLDTITKEQLFVTGQERDNALKAYEKAYRESLMQQYKDLKISEDEKQKLIDSRLKSDTDERKKWMEANDKITQEFAEREIAKDIEAKKQKEEANKIYYETAQFAVQGLFNLQQQYLQNEITLINRKYDEEIRLADGNAQKINEIEEKRRAAEKEFRIKQFRSQQQAAIADVLFRVAPIIAQQIAGVVTAPLAAASYIAAATQIALIAAQPVPEFAKGVENFKGGPAIVGEKGSELIETSKGSFLSPDKATLTYLPKGANVVTASKTREKMQILNSTYKKGQDQFQVIDTSPIASEISKMPVAINRFDENGFTQFVRKGNRTTQILNKRKGY
jgi:hypothetical protein